MTADPLTLYRAEIDTLSCLSSVQRPADSDSSGTYNSGLPGPTSGGGGSGSVRDVHGNGAESGLVRGRAGMG